MNKFRLKTALVLVALSSGVTAAVAQQDTTSPRVVQLTEEGTVVVSVPGPEFDDTFGQTVAVDTRRGGLAGGGTGALLGGAALLLLLGGLGSGGGS